MIFLIHLNIKPPDPDCLHHSRLKIWLNMAAKNMVKIT